jgi:hypothetical protein
MQVLRSSVKSILSVCAFLVGSSLSAQGLVAPPQDAMLLLNHLEIHSKNITDEIAAINDTIQVRGATPFIIAPPVLVQMMQMDPYIHGLVQTNLLAIPPRPRSPIWQRRSVEYMVSWRMADLMFAIQRSRTALNNLVAAFESGANPAPANADFEQSMQMVVNRFSIAVPSAYIYIEALRRTFIVNPVATWPNAELPAILARLEGQVYVLRRNLDLIFVNPLFNPCFPNSWAMVESTFHGFRMDVAAGAALGIAPFPYYRDGWNGNPFFLPQVAPIARPALQPVIDYNVGVWGEQWDRFNQNYVEGYPLGNFQNAVPGVIDPAQMGLNPNGLGTQGFGPGEGIPLNGQNGVNPNMGQGTLEYGPAFGGNQNNGAYGPGYSVPNQPGMNAQPNLGYAPQAGMNGGTVYGPQANGQYSNTYVYDENGRLVPYTGNNGVQNVPQQMQPNYQQGQGQPQQQYLQPQYPQQQYPQQQYPQQQYPQQQYPQQQYPQQQSYSGSVDPSSGYSVNGQQPGTITYPQPQTPVPAAPAVAPSQPSNVNNTDGLLWGDFNYPTNPSQQRNSPRQ